MSSSPERFLIPADLCQNRKQQVHVHRLPRLLHRMKDTIVKGSSKFKIPFRNLESPDSKQYRTLDSYQYIKIWDHLEEDSQVWLAKLDSGSHANFMLRSDAVELHYCIKRIERTFESVDGEEVVVTGCIRPVWRLAIGTQNHQQYAFCVVDKLPNELRVVIGEDTLSQIGVHLHCQNGALVTFSKDGKGVLQ